MISKELEDLIDKAVSQDFILHPITEEDQNNDSYKALSFTLTFNNVKIEYQRKVETINYPVIPRYQFLFGFQPSEGLCIFVQKKQHKVALCEGPMDQISATCSSIHKLVYLLVPSDRFDVYTYFPACCELNCKNSPKEYDLRISLFEKSPE